MEITKLTLGSLASNCYIQSVENGQCVIVDIGEGAPVLLRHLEQMHLKPVAILLTHGHYDHIAGVEQVRKTWNIPVYIHKMDAAMLTDSRLNLGDWLSDLPFRPVKAWETVEEGDHLTFGTADLSVLHTPGHTPGSICWMCEDLLYTGDTLFRMSRGRTDFPCDISW